MDGIVVVEKFGYFEAYIDGKFVCSGDTYSECYKEALDTIRLEDD